MEQTYYPARGVSLLRPFLLSSQVSHRGYSLPLQRRITDFGADVPFGNVNKKLKEHYGIALPESSLKIITLKHAEKIKQIQDRELGTIESPGKLCVISETDGSMIPIVKTSSDSVVDKRKKKSLFYREARLTLAHEKGSKTPVFSATLGDVNEAGQHMRHCVKVVGVNNDTKIHCVGDGAPWIANQIEEHFGANATYLIDFYHTCEYLSAAAPICAMNKEKSWIEEQKKLLKAGQASQVLIALLPHIESQKMPDEEAPVRMCHRYIKSRLHQMDYKTAIDNDLPIGSGEIESAHRYVIQKRLKIAGAWWLEENAENMLALRVARANNHWESYWQDQAA